MVAENVKARTTVSATMRVGSLASRRGLRTRHFYELRRSSWTQLGSRVAVAGVSASSCSSNATPSLGNSICSRCSPRRGRGGVELSWRQRSFLRGQTGGLAGRMGEENPGAERTEGPRRQRRCEWTREGGKEP